MAEGRVGGREKRGEGGRLVQKAGASDYKEGSGQHYAMVCENEKKGGRGEGGNGRGGGWRRGGCDIFWPCVSFLFRQR